MPAMRQLSRAFAAILVLFVAHAAAAQTADDVVEKYLTAIGGRAALSKLTTRAMVGTITVSTPQGELSGPVEIYAQAPNKSRTLVKLDLSALGAGLMTVDQRFDGTTGYVLDSLQGNRDITGNQLENLKNSAFPAPLLNYKERGVVVELGGKEAVGDRQALVLTIQPKSGSATRLFVDAETYLPLKTVIKVDLPQVGELEQTTEFRDYRDVDGFKVPFEVRASSAVQSSSIVLAKVEHNTKIDESLFSKPNP